MRTPDWDATITGAIEGLGVADLSYASTVLEEAHCEAVEAGLPTTTDGDSTTMTAERFIRRCFSEARRFLCTSTAATEAQADEDAEVATFRSSSVGTEATMLVDLTAEVSSALIGIFKSAKDAAEARCPLCSDAGKRSLAGEVLNWADRELQSIDTVTSFRAQASTMATDAATMAKRLAEEQWPTPDAPPSTVEPPPLTYEQSMHNLAADLRDGMPEGVMNIERIIGHIDERRRSDPGEITESRICRAVNELSSTLDLSTPLHGRTKKMLATTKAVIKLFDKEYNRLAR